MNCLPKVKEMNKSGFIVIFDVERKTTKQNQTISNKLIWH